MDRPPRRKFNKRRPAAGGRPGGGRRPPPPEGTGLEAQYLASKKASAAKVVLHLRGGDTVEGTVQDFDQQVIVIQPTDAPSLVVRKTEIRYVEGS